MGKFKMIWVLALLTVNFLSHAQITKPKLLQPATWSYNTSQNEVKVGEELEIIFTAKIDDDWYMYSSDFSCEVGPLVTTFEFESHPSFELVGGIRPIGAKKKYDEIFECDYTYFRATSEFRQTIKVLTPDPVIRGMYEYQVCTDVDGKCIGFDDEFEINNILVASTGKADPQPDSEGQNNQQKEETTPKENIPEESPSSESTEQTTESSPLKLNVVDPAQNNELLESSTEGAEAFVSPGKQIVQNEGDAYPTVIMEQFYPEGYEKPKVSHLWFMVAAFLAGLAALLTPCVFPMIPMTVSFFTGGGSDSKPKGKMQALFYGFSIVFIYTIVGAIVAPLMGPETANHLATEWLPNIIFFSVFFIFALSFFGMFDIVLPSSFINSMDRQADRGGFFGPFFMAFTLVLVSFSCTGPIVSTILVESAGGEVLKPILGMLAFGLAFAIPFTLFAFFPAWVSKLPKSGGWLNSVKVVLGFLELALAFKFLSIADQAFHWGILDREVNIAIWVVIFATLGFYLLGKIKLPHDSDLKHIGVPRLLLAIVTFSFVVYMIPGMFGAPLKALAGYLPPMSSHDFDVAELIRKSGGEDVQYPENCEEPKYADFLHLPHGIQGYFDFDQALACAQAQNKPLFIDFTGHGCVNCREMEAVVWSEPDVLKMLKEDFIVVALYVDDKTELPESEWYISNYDQKLKKTIGKQNADLQIQRAGENAQPNYFLLNHDAKSLNLPVSRTNKNDFLSFLKEGLTNFHEQDQLAKK